MSDESIDGLADTAQTAADRNLRVAIDEALHLLPEGESTGKCSDCRTKIESARLTLLPGTTQCVACAQKRQKLGTTSTN